jgi:hypothetical protein
MQFFAGFALGFISGAIGFLLFCALVSQLVEAGVKEKLDGKA